MLELRNWYNEVSRRVKLSYYCNLLGINCCNFTKFLKGYDGGVKADKLYLMKDLITNDLMNICKKVV